MSTFKRGKIWWFKFKFQNIVVRESSRSPVRAIAQRCERERRRKMELSGSRLKKVGVPMLFSAAVSEWLEDMKPDWSSSNYRIESYNMDHLMEHFSRLLLTDIDARSISRYKAKRQVEGAAPKTINNERGTLRAILRRHHLWAELQTEKSAKPLPVRTEVGRALSDDEEHRLLLACQRSRSRSLYPAVIISLDTGLRNAELRNLRWRNIDLLRGELRVGKSKTAGGEGRVVHLTKRALALLTDWHSNYPKATPSHYVFPSERYGLKGEEGHQSGVAVAYDVDPSKPIGPWKFSWDAAREQAGVECRWHDLRHTFVSRLAEGQTSDATIMSLSGHLSKKMLERYSHVRNEAKRAAIIALENREKVFEGAQKWAQ